MCDHEDWLRERNEKNLTPVYCEGQVVAYIHPEVEPEAVIAYLTEDEIRAILANLNIDMEVLTPEQLEDLWKRIMNEEA